MSAPQEPDVGVDWHALAHRWSEITSDMLHVEDTELRGGAFHAEALRRLLGHPGSGFITDAEHRHTLDTNTKVLKWRVEQAEGQVARVRQRHSRTTFRGEPVCAHCTLQTFRDGEPMFTHLAEWPCDTIRALDGEETAS